MTALGPCPAPLSSQIVDRLLAAKEAFDAHALSAIAAIEEFRNASSALYLHAEEVLGENDEIHDDLIGWMIEVHQTADDLHNATECEWWQNDEFKESNLVKSEMHRLERDLEDVLRHGEDLAVMKRMYERALQSMGLCMTVSSIDNVEDMASQLADTFGRDLRSRPPHW